MQKPEGLLPVVMNLDGDYSKLLPTESPFIKGLTTSINRNPNLGTGTNNPSEEGQNDLSLTPTRSNRKIPNSIKPTGYNKTIGSFESITTHEEYYCVFNGSGRHSIFLYSGDTGEFFKVIEDPTLDFTDDQKGFQAEHRVRLRLIKDADGNVIEKILLFTNGIVWQRWINVMASINTNGFDASLFPYWTLTPPHFDRRELIEWPTRKIMNNPTAVAIQNTDTDKDKPNRVIDNAFRFAAVKNYTDGRPTTLSPYSLPVIIKSEDFLNSPDVLSKNILVTLDAGSPTLESIDIYVQQTEKPQVGTISVAAWSTWKKYIRLYKYDNCNSEGLNVLATEYWKRTNPWSAYNYDAVLNTIQYLFDNSLQAEIPSAEVLRLQDDMPQLSVALTDLGDAAALTNNRYDYDNFNCNVIDNIDVVVKEKENTSCPIQTRKVRLYAYAGKASDNFSYISQVGWYNGSDTQMRWGTVDVGTQAVAVFSVEQSKLFGLDFGDHSAFVCYAKGTPYYSVGQWYQVNQDNSLVKIASLLDFANADTLAYAQNVFIQQGYFICVFDFEIPAGRYDFALGRHNINLTGDFRNTSTWVYGIANSRVKSTTGVPGPAGTVTSLKPNSIIDYSKEMEIDCTSADVDVWGNGKDVFYVYCPYVTDQGNKKFRFIEGYIKESPDNLIGVELLPYSMNIGADDWGKFTDKNGLYFAYTKRANSATAAMEFDIRLNCAFPVHFEVPCSSGNLGWMQNGNGFLSDHNSGQVGDCNRILLNGKITNPDGTIGYSNISVSIKDGGTAVTKQDGTFTLIVHNGMQQPRISNVYVNAGGNFLITLPDCGTIPISLFNEIYSICFNCQKRVYPFDLNLKVIVQGGTQLSLKENASYSPAIIGADLSGRLTYANPLKNATVPSFLQRNNTNATFFQASIKGALNLPKDIKWVAFAVSNQLGILKYIQWVGDSIKYVDSSGNVVTDPASAVFCSIAIDSLYNANLARNFTLLSSYQFVAGDRIRILDNGKGDLLDIDDFGDPIDLQILGTNYNQAAMNADLIPSNSTVPIINNTVNNTITNTVASGGSSSSVSQQTNQNNTSITLYVKYDSRLDQIIKNAGFWIELYTPIQQADKVPYGELKWYPVINGEIAIFKGYSSGVPVYDYPTTIDLDFWDTYLISRSINIPNVGDEFFNHPFESSNISDNWGANINSSGRQSLKNDDAMQKWFGNDVIRSGNFVTGGVLNGLSTFKGSDRKDFSQYPWGDIIATITQRSLVLFICENDWFTTDYQFHYTYANAQGVMVTNLDNSLSTPHQKIKGQYGCAYEFTSSIIIVEEFVFWYDIRNMAYIRCSYRDAGDITDIMDEQGGRHGVKSYFIKKSEFIGKWNRDHGNDKKIDVVTGVNMNTKKIYVTFRPRRGNSNDSSSYFNNQRDLRIDFQETFVFSMGMERWSRTEMFAPECYGKLRGALGVEMFSFAGGDPYFHINGGDGFSNFYGLQGQPVIAAAFNKEGGVEKVLMNVNVHSNAIGFYIDKIFSEEINSFSYVPMNLFKRKTNQYYAAVLRNMNSYPSIDPAQLFRSMLVDGKRNKGSFFVCRFVMDFKNRDQYTELKALYYLFGYSHPIKK